MHLRPLVAIGRSRSLLAVIFASAGSVVLLGAGGLNHPKALTTPSHTPQPRPAGWRWVSPRPQGNALNAGTCLAQRCLVVGNDGTILATTDGGRQWSQVTSGTAEDLEALTCVSESCYAVGAYEGVTISHDTGRTWLARVANRSYTLNGIACASQSTCVAVGWHASQGDFGGFVPGVYLTTRDAGLHWAVHHLPASKSRSDPGLRYDSVSCPNPHICLTISRTPSAIWSSHDGGFTWRKQAILGSRFSPSAIACPSATICYVSAYGGMFKSTNAGQSWFPLKLKNGATSFGYLACGGSTCVSLGSQGLERTDNAGRTWTASTPSGWHNIGGLVCSAGGMCFALGTGGLILSEGHSGPWREYGHGYRFFNLGISCQSGNDCEVLTMDDFGPQCSTGSCGILLTSDGGKTWIHRSARAVDAFNPGAIACPTTRTCYVAVGMLGLTSGPVLKTGDGGASWAILKTPASGKLVDLTGISCPTATTCFVTGEGCLAAKPCHNEGDGIVIATSDRGRSWRLVFHDRSGGVGVQPGNIDCVTVQLCYAVGIPGWIAKTADGGKTWEAEGNPLYNGSTERPSNTDLTAIACSSTSTCVVVGQACRHGAFTCEASGTVSAILTIHNGGHSWTDHSRAYAISGPPLAFGSPVLHSVACSASSHCLTVGDRGIVLASSDGGNSWTRQSVPTDNWLTGVTCPTNRRCFIVGDEGTVLAGP